MAPAVVDSHLHVWDESAAGLDPGPMRIGYSAQATASVELFMEGTFLSKEELDLVMGGTAERLWFG